MPLIAGYECVKCCALSAYATADGDMGMGSGSNREGTGDEPVEGDGVSGRGCRSL